MKGRNNTNAVENLPGGNRKEKKMKLTVENTTEFFRVSDEFDGVVHLSWLGSSLVAISFRSVEDRDHAKEILESDGIFCVANHPQDQTLFIRCDHGVASICVSVDDPNAI